MTLNLLRTSRQHPQLYAAAHYHGLIDYNKTAFAPQGCKMIAHEKPAKRRTWATHGQHGYSLGPAVHHYRCQNVYIYTTASERTVETLEFPPHNSPMPHLSSTDRLIMAINNMTNSSKNTHPKSHLHKSGMPLSIPQVRPAHKYPISPWEMIHLPGGDNAVGR
jgi:hypothetical protein